jgi:hypothetical protein
MELLSAERQLCGCILDKAKPRRADPTYQQGAPPDVIDSDNPQNRLPRPPRPRTHLGLLLLLGAAVLAWVIQPIGAGAVRAEPRAVVGQTTFDFGTIYENLPLTHTFLIRNAGTAPLHIEDVDPDCACTVASYDRTISPGGQGEITLSIKPYSVIHRFKKEAKVTINDPEKPVFYLDMTGVVLPFIEIQPSYIVRLRGAPGDNLQQQVRFISHLPTAWKITGYRTNIPDDIDVSIKPELPDKVYVLTVRNKRQDAGHYAGVIFLSTTSKQRPRLIVRVFGDLYLPSASGP